MIKKATKKKPTRTSVLEAYKTKTEASLKVLLLSVKLSRLEVKTLTEEIKKGGRSRVTILPSQQPSQFGDEREDIGPLWFPEPTNTKLMELREQLRRAEWKVEDEEWKLADSLKEYKERSLVKPSVNEAKDQES
jgi:hypothetical protein